MGRIGAKNKQPSCKFVFPPNLDTSLTENQPFTLKLAVNNIVTGFFANPNTKYYSAPQVRYSFKSFARFLVQGFADGYIACRPSTTTGSL
jgi:hypothetical protein